MNTVHNFDIYAPKLVERNEFFSAGHRACQGCGEVLALRLLLKGLGKDTVVANATGCMEIISSCYPTTAWKVPYIHVAFENAAAVGSGVEAGLKALRRKGKIADRDVKVAAIAGDGGTVDIGLQALSGAMERGHNMVFFCLDNEAYMNTGIQRSSATPFMAATTTSPPGKPSKGSGRGKRTLPKSWWPIMSPTWQRPAPATPWTCWPKWKRPGKSTAPLTFISSPSARRVGALLPIRRSSLAVWLLKRASSRSMRWKTANIAGRLTRRRKEDPSQIIFNHRGVIAIWTPQTLPRSRPWWTRNSKIGAQGQHLRAVVIKT